jgi:hypothetical protein
MTTYNEYYWTQSGQKRFRLNELTIWAVNKLYDTKTNTLGSKARIADRQEQLVKDIKYHGWRRAAKRFRRSVDQWVETNTYESTESQAHLTRGI